ncbi:GyrI-like domain-containing protein [Prosthecochloris sp.]|uniref:AraC family transcriptional regulator n=1 Tax=Prosthecochloris sp. TaxID=290513 RepID=UPI00257C4E44|nr:GyrI-like domain-containing protein [Prosthecochloris sp.]
MRESENKNNTAQSMRAEYISRINRVIDYIENHLDEDLTLGILADVACFSPFHFHRIFKACVGETLSRFINRVRVQKAAYQLSTNPEKTITEIAFDTGFSGSATFARSFKNYFGVSASQWRLNERQPDSKNRKTNSKNGNRVGKKCENIIQSSRYVDSVTRNLKWRIEMKKEKILGIEVKEMPSVYVAYVRHIGPYKGDSQLFEGLFTRLMNWAGPRGLCVPEAKIMAVYHDDPEVTEEDNLRVSACITVPEDTPVQGEVGKMKIDGGKFAVAGFELEGSHEYEEAWNMVIAEWLPESGLQPDDRLGYEVYHNNPEEHPEGHHIVDICLPVKPL